MLTARLSEENEKESRDCGADDYFKKPFDLDMLKQHINRLLKSGTAAKDAKVEPRITQEEITPLDEQFVNDATAYVEKHLDDSTLTVERMSKDLGMSRVNLYRRMVAVTGKTPSEFLRLVRLRHTEKLVMKSQLTVSEISYKVGFASPRYFSKCYKELFGYLPSQYKRNRTLPTAGTCGPRQCVRSAPSLARRLSGMLGQESIKTRNRQSLYG